MVVAERPAHQGTSPSGNAAVRELLAARRADAELRVESLKRRVDAVVESSSLTTDDDEHDPEGATIAFERAQLLTLLAQARADVDDLDRAAERLRNGTYHRCERCGQPIGEQRSAALPATRTCIRCTTARR